MDDPGFPGAPDSVAERFMEALEPPPKPFRMVWVFKDGRSFTTVSPDKATADALIHEWAMFRRGKLPDRIVNNDMLIGGDGWAFDMTALAAVIAEEVKPTPPAAKQPCWVCAALIGLPFLMSAAALTLVLIR